MRATWAHLRGYWLLYVPAGAALLLAVTITRGLWWQWQAIFTASPAVPPPMTAAPPPAPASRAAVPGSGAAPATGGVNPGPAVPAGAKRPLPPTDEAAPRNTTDRYGVTYDAQGVAVMGIDADPGGVYNVPPGRQVRIGGPGGNLFDVGPNGQLTPAPQVRG